MDHVIKVERVEIEVKQDISEPTRNPILLDIDSEVYFVEHVVKSQYDETEVQEDVSSTDSISDYTEYKYAVTDPISESVSSDNGSISVCQINRKNTIPIKNNTLDNALISEYDEIQRKQDISSIDLNTEVCTEDKYPVYEANRSLVIDSIQSNTQNTKDPSSNYIVEHMGLVKYKYDEIRVKQENISSIDFKPGDKSTVAEAKTEAVSLVIDPIPTCQINTQNTSEDYNIVKAPNAVHSLKTPVACQRISEEFIKRNNEGRWPMHTEKQPVSNEFIPEMDCEINNPKIHQIVYKGKKFPCVSCTNSFSKKSQLEMHNTLTHKRNTHFSCDVCTKVFSHRSNLKKHLLIHTGEKNFYCDVCAKAFTQKGNLKTHMLTHKKDKYFSCDICTKEFSCRDLFFEHIITHKEYIYFPCDVCSRIFLRRSNLKTHQRTHNEYKYFPCDVCTRVFSHRSNLKRHQLTHTEGKCFSCDVCTKIFTRRCSLKRHEVIHIGERSFSCDVCTKRFTRKSGLKRHELIHEKENYFSCEVCTNSFPRKSSLKTHMLIHSEQKYFSCDVCTKVFAYRSDLKRHQLTHTGEKYFSCHVCTKEFSRRSHLKRHQDTHTREK